MAKKDHYARMQDSDYHKDGGCVIRHTSDFNQDNLCNHRGQAYKISLKSRKALYNSYDIDSIKDLPAKRTKFKDKNGKERGFDYEVNTPTKDNPDCWYIGVGENFKHSYKIPYLHNAHHIITNGELNEKLNIEYKGTYRNVLIYLMAEKYNINAGRNVIILPKEKKISKIIQLPYHCPGNSRNHPEYSKYVSCQLEQMRRDLNDIFEDLTCEEKRICVRNLKKQLGELSDDLLKQIIDLGKTKTKKDTIKGINIEEIIKH